MPPIERHQRTGRARKWKRSLRLADWSESWARGTSASENVERSQTVSRGRPRFLQSRQEYGVGAGVGGGDEQGSRSPSRDRSQSPDSANGDVESGNDSLDDGALSDDSGDEIDGDMTDGEATDGELTDGETTDGDITDDDLSDSDDENDGADADIDSPPSTPVSDGIPTLTLSPPGSGVTTTAVPVISSRATNPASPIDMPDQTMTPIIAPTATEDPSIATSLSLISTIPTAEVTRSPQKGVVDDDAPLFTAPFPILDDEVVPTASPTESLIIATDTAVPVATQGPDSPDFDKEFDRDQWEEDYREMLRMGPPPGASGLSEASEHALIAIGSIGAFILFCFIAWVGYRMMKRYQEGDKVTDIFTRRRDYPRRGGSGVPTEPPPVYEKGNASMSQAQGYYGGDKRQPGSLARTGTWGSQQGLIAKPASNEGTMTNIVAGYGSQSGTLQNSSATLQANPAAVGARIADDQLALANQPADPYDPTKPSSLQQPLPMYRISQLSSLSSGFGDGDIVVTQPMAPQPLTAPPPVAQPLRAPNNEPDARDSRASWQSRPNERRETVYTQASEDRPIRFRSIHSWVNQQSGRVQRATSRARDRGEVPVMPAVPGELNVTQQTAYR